MILEIIHFYANLLLPMDITPVSCCVCAFILLHKHMLQTSQTATILTKITYMESDIFSRMLQHVFLILDLHLYLFYLHSLSIFIHTFGILFVL